jgi:hypothetical protein
MRHDTSIARTGNYSGILCDMCSDLVIQIIRYFSAMIMPLRRRLFLWNAHHSDHGDHMDWGEPLC